MVSDRVKKRRYEYKYRISEAKASELRAFLRQFLSYDDYCAGSEDYAYRVHSLYLDSPGYTTFHDTVNGNRNRFKLRIRYYDNRPDSPLFFEVKQRFDRVIHKKRAVVQREGYRELLSGKPPLSRHLMIDDAENLQALRAFSRRLHRLNAMPRVHVAYRREAFEDKEKDSARVTFDREVLSEPVSGTGLPVELSNPVSVFGNTVILEIKFTNRFPFWLEEMTQRYDLRREAAAKYAEGIIRRNSGIIS